VVTVDRNVDVPAFNESGQRDVVSLTAGTVFREARPYDSRHLICASRQGMRGMFYVVPRDAVTVRADEDGEEDIPSFEEYAERIDTLEPGTGTPPMAVSPGLEVPEQELKEMLFYDPSGRPLGPRGPYEYDYLAEPAGQRFIYMRVPVQIGQRVSPMHMESEQAGKPPRMPKGQSYDAYVKRLEWQDSDEQDASGKKVKKLSAFFRFYRFMPKILDTKTGKTFAVQDKSDGQRQAERILALEEEMAGPEVTQHGMFQLRRVPDPQGTYLYEITVPGSPSLQDEPLRSLKEAQGYVDEGLERLLDKAAPYLTKA